MWYNDQKSLSEISIYDLVNALGTKIHISKHINMEHDDAVFLLTSLLNNFTYKNKNAADVNIINDLIIQCKMLYGEDLAKRNQAMAESRQARIDYIKAKKTKYNNELKTLKSMLGDIKTDITDDLANIFSVMQKSIELNNKFKSLDELLLQFSDHELEVFNMMCEKHVILTSKFFYGKYKIFINKYKLEELYEHLYPLKFSNYKVTSYQIFNNYEKISELEVGIGSWYYGFKHYDTNDGNRIILQFKSEFGDIIPDKLSKYIKV